MINSVVKLTGAVAATGCIAFVAGRNLPAGKYGRPKQVGYLLCTGNKVVGLAEDPIERKQVHIFVQREVGVVPEDDDNPHVSGDDSDRDKRYMPSSKAYTVVKKDKKAIDACREISINDARKYIPGISVGETIYIKWKSDCKNYDPTTDRCKTCKGDCKDRMPVDDDVKEKMKPVYTTELITREEVTCHVIVNTGFTEIGESAFRKHPVTKVSLPSTLKHIGAYAFSETEIEEIYIPNSVRTIDEGAFAYCKKLRKVHFGGSSSLLTIGSNAFKGCSNLEEFIVPRETRKIGYRAFEGCNNMTSFIVRGTSNDKKLHIYVDRDSIWAFDYCSSLKYIDIRRVDMIPDKAFKLILENGDSKNKLMVPQGAFAKVSPEYLNTIQQSNWTIVSE